MGHKIESEREREREIGRERKRNISRNKEREREEHFFTCDCFNFWPSKKVGAISHA
jgi:hypothetical protein